MRPAFALKLVNDVVPAQDAATAVVNPHTAEPRAHWINLASGRWQQKERWFYGHPPSSVSPM